MADYMMYTRALENVILWGLLALPLAELAAVCVLTLDKLPPQQRRGLFALFFIMLGLAAVLFGGEWLLGRSGLTYRTWFRAGLGAVLWLVGLAAGIMTVAYAGRWLTGRGKGTKGVVTGLSAFCLASAMLVGTVLGGLWALGPSEQVVAYAGQKAILGAWGWGSGYQLYEYHGPLVRGAGPFLVDWDESLVEGTVNVPWNTLW